MANSPKRIQSLQNAMRVIAAIAGSEDGLRLQDLAAAVGLTAGAVHHIVDTLAADGWVERVEQPVRYRLGHALPALVARQGTRRLVRAVDAGMEELLRRLGGGSLSYCEAAGMEILITRAADAAHGGRVAAVTGTVLQPYTSAASVVHLAWWPAERVQTYRELRPFEAHGLPLWGSAERFAAVLATARQEGFVDLPLADPAMLRIGVPVLDAAGALHASLTITVRGDAAMRARVIAEGLAFTRAIRSALQGDDHDRDP